MLSDSTSVAQLSEIITQVTAPAFLLGAVAAFVALLITRMNRIIDRSQALSAIGNDDAARAHFKADIPVVKRRAVLLNNAIFLAAISGIVTTILIILAFGCAFYRVRHEHGVAILFVLALGFFAAALVNLAREARVAVHELEHFR